MSNLYSESLRQYLASQEAEPIQPKPSHEALIADIDLYLAKGHYATLRPKAVFLLQRAREALQGER